MKKNTLIFLLSAFLAGHGLMAQDQKIYSQFFMNPYVINPAYAGATGYTTFFGVHRQQWLGLEGAPAYSHISFSTPLENNISVGAMAYNSSVGPLNSSAAKITGGYLLELDRKQFIRFGMSIGGGYTSYDLDNSLDPSIIQFQQSSTSFIMADLGVSYYYENFNVALSIPNLIGRNEVDANGFSEINIEPYKDLTLQANYRHFVNKDFSIEPHLIYRFSVDNLSEYEGAVIAHIGHVIWAGLNYRQDYGMGALFGLKIQEKGAVGFAYEYGYSELEGATSGTFEVSLGLQLGDNKKNQRQAVSFIHNFKKSKHEKSKSSTRSQYLAQQRAKAAEERAQQAATAATAAQTAQQTTTPAETTPTEEPVTKTETATTNTSSSTVVSETIDHDTPLQHRTTDKGIWEIGATYIQTRADSTKTKELKWHDALTDTPDHAELPPNTHRRVPGNILELPAGHHVVAGEFDTYEEAEDYSDKIFEMGFHGSLVGHLESLEDKKYVVVVHKGATMGIAREEQDKWSKRKNLNHVYILNVVE
ncbi:type IX secretion system membrane protein, PorP/SprF family [Reichenbachiella faecimaris]|uniref:Type IX secretion system membrane protein, PorP/SprF family n=1 Tax=Reichenbachiella faecimaris TaxID=692418 RepID=A0A1W2G4Q0_REIFA|nr:PorP/SprF family type IX secretion system membrane protein [Reichenbachiella faecimaris]SMD31640.1 type IX secretion system membrane protein, PorP/SprF family [Reichenbachiella faecimaris]